MPDKSVQVAAQVLADTLAVAVTQAPYGRNLVTRHRGN